MSRRFRHWLKRFRRDRRGNPAVEFALFAPLLVLMFAALLEIGNLLMVHLKVWHSTVTVGDLATRTEEISEGEITDLYRVVEQVMKPYVTGGDKSLFIVTAVSRLADGYPPVLCWRRTGAGTMSETSDLTYSEGNSITQVPNDLTDMMPRTGETLVLVETFYSYTPLIFDLFSVTHTIRKRAFYRPRIGALQNITDASSQHC